jgi:hypothetical protein
LGEKVFIDLWELWKEMDFVFVMGTMGRVRFLKSNLLLCSIPFLYDYGEKSMGA